MRSFFENDGFGGAIACWGCEGRSFFENDGFGGAIFFGGDMGVRSFFGVWKCDHFGGDMGVICVNLMCNSC
jgi:hypothetical protein